jgi:hypothetical protein
MFRGAGGCHNLSQTLTHGAFILIQINLEIGTSLGTG